jgi:hypothetical protein
MARMTGLKLRKAIKDGKLVMAAGGPEGQKPCRYEPRTTYDPQPWFNGTYRYNATELEIKYRDPVDYQRWLASSESNLGETYADTRSKHAGGVAE